MSFVTRYISEALLLNQSWYYTGIHKECPAIFNKALWTLGFNTKDFDIEVRECEHRVLEHSPITHNGIMFVGYERLDREWCRSGHMTMEAVIASSNDKDHRKELVELATAAKFKED